MQTGRFCVTPPKSLTEPEPGFLKTSRWPPPASRAPPVRKAEARALLTTAARCHLTHRTGAGSPATLGHVAHPVLNPRELAGASDPLRGARRLLPALGHGTLAPFPAPPRRARPPPPCRVLGRPRHRAAGSRVLVSLSVLRSCHPITSRVLSVSGSRLLLPRGTVTVVASRAGGVGTAGLSPRSCEAACGLGRRLASDTSLVLMKHHPAVCPSYPLRWRLATRAA